MFVLFDQGTPVPLRTFLSGHSVETTAQRSWERLKNGELLKAAEAAGFDVFVTPDKSIRFQQNLKNYRIAVVVLASSMADTAPARCPSRGCSECCKAWHLF